LYAHILRAYRMQLPKSAKNICISCTIALFLNRNYRACDLHTVEGDRMRLDRGPLKKG